MKRHKTNIDSTFDGFMCKIRARQMKKLELYEVRKSARIESAPIVMHTLTKAYRLPRFMGSKRIVGWRKVSDRNKNPFKLSFPRDHNSSQWIESLCFSSRK